MKLNRIYRNLISNFIVQIIVTLVGIIIPKFIILTYGSTLNGMVGSISQFLMYAGLVEAGIGNAAVIALYEPLSKNSKEDISAVLSEAARRYKKSGIIYIVITFVIACIYPLMVKTQVNYSFAFSMTLILALTGVIDYLLIGKYKVLLTADNRYYIINFSKAIASCVMACGSIFLLQNGASLLSVKGLAVLAHLGEALFIRGYVKRKYFQYSFQSNRKIELEQQRSALLHQICMVITYNTDLIVLTLLLKENSLQEVSVYSVYALIVSFVRNMMSALCTGINATFGELYVKKEMEKLQRRFSHYELIYYVCLFALYLCFMVLILPFVRCYIGKLTDINYVRKEVAIMFGIVGLLAQLKDAYGTLVTGACGCYKETGKYAIYEAIVNLSLSLIFVQKLGIVGVLIGTAISHLFMDFGIMRYGCCVILPKMKHLTIARVIRNTMLFVGLGTIEMKITMNIGDWRAWLYSACGFTIVNIILFIVWNCLFEKNNMIEALPEKMQQIIFRYIKQKGE